MRGYKKSRPELQDRAALVNRVYLSLTRHTITRICRLVKRGWKAENPCCCQARTLYYQVGYLRVCSLTCPKSGDGHAERSEASRLPLTRLFAPLFRNLAPSNDLSRPGATRAKVATMNCRSSFCLPARCARPAVWNSECQLWASPTLARDAHQLDQSRDLSPRSGAHKRQGHSGRCVIHATSLFTFALSSSCFNAT